MAKSFILVKYFANNGTEHRFERDTLEEAILEYRKRRKRGNVNWGQYCLDGNLDWKYL